MPEKCIRACLEGREFLWDMLEDIIIDKMALLRTFIREWLFGPTPLSVLSLLPDAFFGDSSFGATKIFHVIDNTHEI